MQAPKFGSYYEEIAYHSKVSKRIIKDGGLNISVVSSKKKQDYREGKPAPGTPQFIAYNAAEIARGSRILVQIPEPDKIIQPSKDKIQFTPKQRNETTFLIKQTAELVDCDSEKLADIKAAVSKALGKEANPNMSDSKARTPLMWSVNHPDIVDILIKNGAKLFLSNGSILNPFFRVRTLEAFKHLLKAAKIPEDVESIRTVLSYTNEKNETLIQNLFRKGRGKLAIEILRLIESDDEKILTIIDPITYRLIVQQAQSNNVENLSEVFKLIPKNRLKNFFERELFRACRTKKCFQFVFDLSGKSAKQILSERDEKGISTIVYLVTQEGDLTEKADLLNYLFDLLEGEVTKVMTPKEVRVVLEKGKFTQEQKDGISQTYQRNSKERLLDIVGFIQKRDFLSAIQQVYALKSLRDDKKKEIFSSSTINLIYELPYTCRDQEHFKEIIEAIFRNGNFEDAKCTPMQLVQKFEYDDLIAMAGKAEGLNNPYKLALRSLRLFDFYELLERSEKNSENLIYRNSLEKIFEGVHGLAKQHRDNPSNFHITVVDYLYKEEKKLNKVVDVSSEDIEKIREEISKIVKSICTVEIKNKEAIVQLRSCLHKNMKKELVDFINQNNPDLIEVGVVRRHKSQSDLTPRNKRNSWKRLSMKVASVPDDIVKAFQSDSEKEEKKTQTG